MEWMGEGNYMEPDIKFGKGYIEYLRKALEEKWLKSYISTESHYPADIV